MPTLPRTQAQALLPWALVAIGFAAVYIPSFIDLFNGTWATDQQGHGPIALAVVAVGLLLYVLGRWQDTLLFEIGSLLWLVTGTLLLFPSPSTACRSRRLQRFSPMRCRSQCSMTHEFPGRRPAVLSAQSLDHLNQLRGFRHVARNTYAHQLDHDRLINNAQFAIRLLPLLAADVDSLERYMMSDDSSAPH